MIYKIVIEKRARKFIEKLPKTEKERVLRIISKLPNGTDIKPIKGYTEYLRLRVGEYRIIYTQNDATLTICVVDAGNRGDIYKRY